MAASAACCDERHEDQSVIHPSCGASCGLMEVARRLLPPLCSGSQRPPRTGKSQTSHLRRSSLQSAPLRRQAEVEIGGSSGSVQGTSPFWALKMFAAFAARYTTVWPN